MYLQGTTFKPQGRSTDPQELALLEAQSLVILHSHSYNQAS